MKQYFRKLFKDTFPLLVMVVWWVCVIPMIDKTEPARAFFLEGLTLLVMEFIAQRLVVRRLS